MTRKLPGGIGTLVFAARLVQAGGGRIIRINGNQVPGHDIRWRTAGGDLVLVERKDRSYEAASLIRRERALRVVAYVKECRIPTEAGAARILVVGFQHLVRQSEMDVVDPGYQRALEEAFPQNTRQGLPHAVVVEHLGMEPSTGGEKSNFFSPQPLNWEVPLMDRVGVLLVRAIGAQHLLGT